MASLTVAKWCPKKAPREGIAACPQVQVASFCNWSSFSMDLELLEPGFTCFLPVISSLSEIELWNAGGRLGAFLVPSCLPMVCLFCFLFFLGNFIELLAVNYQHNLVDHIDIHTESISTLSVSKSSIFQTYSQINHSAHSSLKRQFVFRKNCTTFSFAQL